MAKPSTNAAIVAFEDPVLGSATEEFKRLDPDIAMTFFRHLEDVVKRKIDHWTLAEFDAYQGIPIYKAEVSGEIMIYAAEEQSLGDLKLTVMFCGRRGGRRRVGRFVWDGQDIDALKQHVVQPRAAVWFK